MAHTRLTTLALFMALALPVHAEEPNRLPRALSDPALLAGHTWRLDPSIDKAVSNWPLYEGEQGFADKTVLRRVELQVAGATLEAEYRVFLKEPLAEIVLSGAKFDESFCARHVAAGPKRRSIHPIWG